MSHKGIFITFEGGEGSGKSTQVKLLADYFRSLGNDVVITREPGGTSQAEKIRDLVIQREEKWAPIEDCLLFLAARHNHVEKLIKPALDAGKIVICDRFSDSTTSYQGYGLGLDFEVIESLKTTVLGDFEPDFTFVLDIDPEVGVGRSEVRLLQESSHEDRFERMDYSFHKKLRQGYLMIAKQNEDRCVVLDAQQEIDTLHTEIKNYIDIWLAQ